jgi:hypothetical protein
MKQINAILIASILAICVSASGCIFVRSSAISDRAGTGTSISGSASDFGYVYLIAPSGLTQAALANLLGNCATGRVSGVTTELNMRDFLIAQYYTVSVTGSCS